MPLKKGHDPKTISDNIHELKQAGHTHDQAVAIAIQLAHKSTKSKGEKK